MRPTTGVLALTAILLLAGCESDEERAARFFESGMELFEAGDVDRAMVEFRNALSRDGNHEQARLMFARISLEQGHTRRAVDSYVRLVEHNPELLEGRIALAEIAAFNQAWEDAERHGRAAFELAPENVDAQAVNLVLDYRQALLEGDDEARGALVAQAEALVLERPDSVLLRNVLVDGRTWQGDLRGALEQIDLALEIEPEHKPLYYSKLSVLGQIGDEAAIEAHLREMVTKFPDDDDIKAALIRYFVSTDDMQKAEDFFREVADPNAEEVGPYLAFIRFLSETRGDAAAIQELDRTAETSAHASILRSVRAGLKFDIGEREAAIAEMESVLAAEPPASLANDLKVALAQMLAANGNEVGARRRVEEVLAADPGNAEALKMRAGWLLEADEIDEAISVLRQALDTQPSDVEAIEALATAYSRAGSHELSRDTRALAVTTSNHAPGPTLRYAAVLIEGGRLRTAESILVDALRNAPENVALLAELGRVYLIEQDFSRGQGVVRRLETLATDEALSVARDLRLGLLSAQERTGELLALVEEMSSADDADAKARALLIRIRLADGDMQGALSVAEEAHQARPGDLDAHLMLAATRAAIGDLEGAIEDYRFLIGEGRGDGAVHRLLTVALLSNGEEEAARAALEAGLSAFPDDPDLLWMQASLMEQAGDIDGAIAIYEALYETNSASPLIANNLASLLATWRSEDAETLERAFNIARRLRGTEVPEFQDTYGWIVHLRGESEDALDYLEPAADALRDDAIVQYHYAMALLGAGRQDEAREQFRQALDVAGESDTRPQLEAAREALDSLQNAPIGETNSEN